MIENKTVSEAVYAVNGLKPSVFGYPDTKIAMPFIWLKVTQIGNSFSESAGKDTWLAQAVHTNTEPARGRNTVVDREVWRIFSTL